MKRFAVSLLGLLLLANVPVAPAGAASPPTVVVDNSLGNTIATGKVLTSDPTNALVTVTNAYNFWVGVDLDPPVGGALLAPADLLTNAGGIFAKIGALGPGSSGAWHGTFPTTGSSSQAVFVHYDVATGTGRIAVTLTILTIIADTFGDALDVPGSEIVQTALAVVDNLPDVIALVQAVQAFDVYDAGIAAMNLFGSSVEKGAIRSALGDLGVTVTDAQLSSLDTISGLIDFAQTMTDLVSAAVGGHTAGEVKFETSNSGVAATLPPGSTIPPIATAAPVVAGCNPAQFGPDPIGPLTLLSQGHNAFGDEIGNFRIRWGFTGDQVAPPGYGLTIGADPETDTVSGQFVGQGPDPIPARVGTYSQEIEAIYRFPGKKLTTDCVLVCINFTKASANAINAPVVECRRFVMTLNWK